MRWKELVSMFRKTPPRMLTIEDIKKEVFAAIGRNKDYVMALTGDEGEGKSLTACQIAQALYPDFDLRKNVVYTESVVEFNEKYEPLPPKSVFIIDEAIKVLYKMDFAQRKTKKMVVRYTADVRKEKMACHILCIPVLAELHKNFRNHRVKMWIELLDRGDFRKNWVVGVVFVKRRNPFSESYSDPWFLSTFTKIWQDKIRDHTVMDLENYLEFLRSHPFYFGEIAFQRPPIRFEKAYIKERNAAKEKYSLFTEHENLTAMEKRYKTRLATLIFYLYYKYKMPTKLIGEITGMTIHNIGMMLRNVKRDPITYPFVKEFKDILSKEKMAKMEKEANEKYLNSLKQIKV